MLNDKILITQVLSSRIGTKLIATLRDGKQGRAERFLVKYISRKMST